MKKNIIISAQLLIIIILSGYLSKYYFESKTLRQHWGFEEKARNEQQILSMDEIKNYFSKKMSVPVGDLIITISDFKNKTYSGSVSVNPKNCKPDDYCGGSAFYLSKKNGVIFSEETNGEFNCKSLTDKGFDLSTVDSMGMGCYVAK